MVRTLFQKPPETLRGQPSLPSHPVTRTTSQIMPVQDAYLNTLFNRYNNALETNNEKLMFLYRKQIEDYAKSKGYTLNWSTSRASPIPSPFQTLFVGRITAVQSYNTLTKQQQQLLDTLHLKDIYMKSVQTNNPALFNTAYEKAIEEYVKQKETEGYVFEKTEEGYKLKEGELQGPERTSYFAFREKHPIEKLFTEFGMIFSDWSRLTETVAIQQHEAPSQQEAKWWHRVGYPASIGAGTAAQQGPIESTKYILSQPTLFLMGTAGISSVIRGGGGYLAETFPKVHSILFKPVMTTIGAITGVETVKGGIESYQKGTLFPYLGQLGYQIGASFIGTKSAPKGVTYGYRQRLLAFAKTDVERARLKDIFSLIEKNKAVPSTGRRPLDINIDIEKLIGNTAQQEALLKFLQSPIGRKYNARFIFGGSGSQALYLKGTKEYPLRTPKDIDIAVKRATEAEVKVIKSKMLESGIDLSIYDIHPYSPPGSAFTQRGAGVTSRPIRTKSSVFKYQERLGEQAGKKAASTLSPLRTMRGKDWYDALQIAAEKWKQSPSNKKLFSRLEKWKPELAEGTYQLKGPSYYETHPIEASTSKITLQQRLIKKYGQPFYSYKEFFSSEEWIKKVKPEEIKQTEPYRPKVEFKQPPPPSWGKGTTFFSSILPSSIPTSELLKDTYVPITYVSPSGSNLSTPQLNIPSITITSPSAKAPSYPSYAPYPSEYPTTTKQVQYPSIYPYGISPYDVSATQKEKTVVYETETEEKEKKQIGIGYIVYLKKEATKPTRRWLRLNKKPLDYPSAMGLGSMRAKNTAARTFKLQREKGEVQHNNDYARYWQTHQQQFYLKQGTSNIYIQRTQFSISTWGEKKEITFAPRRPKPIKFKQSFKPFKMGMVKL